MEKYRRKIDGYLCVKVTYFTYFTLFPKWSIDWIHSNFSSVQIFELMICNPFIKREVSFLPDFKYTKSAIGFFITEEVAEGFQSRNMQKYDGDNAYNRYSQDHADDTP